MNKESTQGKGVSDCYVFKSRLQEYAQKVGFSTPVYETIKEGPSHEPLFRSTVVVNDARYDSLPGFFNRKAAEQSAAEIALLELAKCGDKKESIAQPVHEIGLCKNLLQEYAQKMNYAMPTYECKKEDKEGRGGHFSCIVEIGSIRYIGAVARTKKEAEIKAARTALLAIQTSPSEMGESLDEETKFTVVPCKRKEPEPITPKQEVVKTRKTKKSRLKKKPFKKQQVGNKNGSQVGNANTELGTELQAVAPSGNGSLDVPISNTIQNHRNTAASEGLLNPDVQISPDQPISMNDTPDVQISADQPISMNGTPDVQISADQPISMNDTAKNQDEVSARPLFDEGKEILVEDVAVTRANLSTPVTTTPSENGSLPINDSHKDTAVSEGSLNPISDSQPIMNATRTVEDEISNANGDLKGDDTIEKNEG